MNEHPTFAPKRGLTDEEQRKVKAWEKAGKIKKCPAVGSKELIALGMEKQRKWLERVGMAIKIKLGMVPLLRPERTEKEKKERRKEREREWRRKKKEKANGRAAD